MPPSVSSPKRPVAQPRAAAHVQAEPRRRLAHGSGMLTSSDPYVGTTLNNRYLIEAKIGEGGFSSVYRGVQLATGRKVALKLLHVDKSHDEAMIARFRREAKVLCNLCDPHTITTYDFDRTADGTLYIAMELLSGRSLATVYEQDAPIAWKRVLRIVREMCSSLAEAHAQGIVHRDLKPENVFLESWADHPDFVKVLDFGIAKPMRTTAQQQPDLELTAVGETLGTLVYMSPEQLMSQPLDGQSDIYSLGVLAYEMMTGRLPYPDANGPVAMITAQLMGAPLPPSTVIGEIPAFVDQIVGRCLESNRHQRFLDVTELANAIAPLIDEELVLARPSPSHLVFDPRPTPAEIELENERTMALASKESPALGVPVASPHAPTRLSSPSPLTVDTMPPTASPIAATRSSAPIGQPMQPVQAMPPAQRPVARSPYPIVQPQPHVGYPVVARTPDGTVRTPDGWVRPSDGTVRSPDARRSPIPFLLLILLFAAIGVGLGLVIVQMMH